MIDRSLRTLFATGLFRDVTVARAGDRILVEVTDCAILRRTIYGRKVRGEGDEEPRPLQKRRFDDRKPAFGGSVAVGLIAVALGLSLPDGADGFASLGQALEDVLAFFKREGGRVAPGRCRPPHRAEDRPGPRDPPIAAGRPRPRHGLHRR